MLSNLYFYLGWASTLAVLGCVVLLLCHVRHLNERIQGLQKDHGKLRGLVEGVALGFMLIDDGQVVAQNKRLRTMFDLSGPARSADHLTKLLVDCDLAALCAKAADKGYPVEVKDVGMGSKILHLFVGPVTSGEHGSRTVIGTVVLVQDVTEEQVLARSKDEFFSIASHELNTPLTAIKGNSGMMLKYFGTELAKKPDMKGMVEDIHESSTRLINIVHDFLDMSRIEQGKMALRMGPVAIDRVVELIFYEMRTVASEKQIALTTDMRTLDAIPTVWGDKDRVTQILYNLIGNAAKFTEAGDITVSSTVEGKFLKIRVTDTGRGIPQRDQKLLFHKFQQADNLHTRDTTRGTGLGLYISKLMAENMHGHIGLESSEEGKGATFYLELPIATEEQLAK